MLDFIRIACAVPRVSVGDVQKNVQVICEEMARADKENADILVFPELSVTGYSCADLFLQDALCSAAAMGLQRIVTASKKHPAMTVIVGAPIRLNCKLLNCAVVIQNGGIRGIVPKTYLSGEESRWFYPGDDLKETAAGLDLFGFEEIGFISLGTDILFRLGDGAVLGIEICEDLNAPIPPSSFLALNGANVIVNLSASPALAGKAAQREQAVKHQSAALHCIYAYCSAGCSESTSDTVYSGYGIIAENGSILQSSGTWPCDQYTLVADCDLGRVQADRGKDVSFRKACARFGSREYLTEPDRRAVSLRGDGTLYPLRKLAFVPEETQKRADRCMEIFQMQVTGLKQRLSVINARPVIGISGGLDSALALLVCVEAVRQLGRPAADVLGITMPCFGTTDRTYNNARKLMEELGITWKEISVANAVMQHFSDIGHNAADRDTTYENAQARERTQILMDYAGKVGGIVVGTGDMSELALGWCTYNGDHMSMYSVNANVPKSLIPYVIETLARQPHFSHAQQVLSDICATPISPELLPPDAWGIISQQTEDIVGPYALHDFFLYHMLRYGFAPKKIYALACRAFAGDFDSQAIKKWLTVFYKRFFSQQFKRNCMPDGVKIGSVSLSSRGDWRMPSDASGRLWLSEIEQL